MTSAGGLRSAPSFKPVGLADRRTPAPMGERTIEPEETLELQSETDQRLASIVESSDDAIISKDFDGVITSWNRGAERLFGYTAEEVIGKPVTVLIPLERHDEEPEILGRIRRGDRVDHYETVRRRKDGTLIDISLSVSPIRGPDGRIIGASKIARDITDRRRAQEQQQLLLREMNHRVKNLFALANGVVALSARTARTPEELATAVQARLDALARAHSLAIARPRELGAPEEQPTTVHALLRTMVSPYLAPSEGEGAQLELSGSDLPVRGPAVSALALLLHEFATNAAKYGALSAPTGLVSVDCVRDGPSLVLTWVERGGPPIDAPCEAEGFGSLLARTAVKGQLGGEISRRWDRQGLTIVMTMAADLVSAPAGP
jgi:PAS domain S-box-containing protein